MSETTSPSFQMLNFDSLNKKRVLLRAPVLTQSGYGVHARQIASWLSSIDSIDLQVQALPWGNTPWLIDRNKDDGFIGYLMERTVNPSGVAYDVSVQLQLPNEWDPKLAKTNIGITAGVETDICNPNWINSCNLMSAVVVPSSHAEKTFRNTGNVSVPLHVIPEAYCKAIVDKKETKVDALKFSTPFNFLFVGQITGSNPENERKNFFYTIKWFCENFSHDEEVGLIIKTNAGRNTKLDRRTVEALLGNLLKEVRKGVNPRIHLIHGELGDEEMASLYRHPQVKALVTLTRGEGFGLPILEAAASGLPVIATNWSGHVDFMSKGKYIEVSHKIDKIHPSRVDGNIFMKDSKWAYADEEDFKKKITKFRNGSATPTTWAKDLQTKILEEYSIEGICRQYDELFGGLFR